VTHDDSVTAHLLGEPRFARNGRAVPVPLGSMRLLAFMLTRPKRHATRAQLMAALNETGPESSARRRLNTAVWRLRCAFEVDGVPREDVIATTPHGLAIAPRCSWWVDVEEFDRGCRVARPVAEWTLDDVRAMRRGLDHYAGDFMDGLYDDWALAERGRLSEVHVSALLRMVRWHERSGKAEAALEYATAAAAVEPLREDLQRLLMRQYRRAGLPEMAVQHYESFRELLADELGVEPLPETRDAGLGLSAAPRLSVQNATRTVMEVLGELERTREELRVITGQVEHSISALRGQLVPDSRAR
jgi:DNA-binding SARP family transcriptional activator